MSHITELKKTIIATDSLITGTLRYDIQNATEQVASAHWSYASDGGAIGAINLTLDHPIPSGSYIKEFIVNTTTALSEASGTPTVALSILAANDLLTATNFSSAPYNVSGTAPYKVDKTTTALKTTAEETTIQFTVASAALDAGVVEFYIVFVAPDMSLA